MEQENKVPVVYILQTFLLALLIMGTKLCLNVQSRLS